MPEAPNEIGKVVLVRSNLADRDIRSPKEIKALLRAGYAVVLLSWDRECKAVSAVKPTDYEEIQLRCRAPWGTGVLPFLLIVILTASFWHMAAANKKGGASKESVDMLSRGRWKVVFWVGGIFCGLILPLVFIFAGGKTAPLIVLPISAAARVAGDYCYRLAILKTGVYESVL